eukprot:3025312-Rhodomonas_salina.4
MAAVPGQQDMVRPGPLAEGEVVAVVIGSRTNLLGGGALGGKVQKVRRTHPLTVLRYGYGVSSTGIASVVVLWLWYAISHTDAGRAAAS